MRVLIVENQPRAARALRQCLGEEGFQAEVCPEAAEAARRVRTTGYDLVVLSLLPAADHAFALLRGWRRGGVNVPVLALSAAGNVAERVQCLDLGADDYVCRPFQFAELTARVRALVRRAHRVSDPVVRAH